MKSQLNDIYPIDTQKVILEQITRMIKWYLLLEKHMSQKNLSLIFPKHENYQH